MVIGAGVFNLGAGEQITSIRERGNVLAVDRSQVPSDMIKMQMGSQHHVHGAEPAVDGCIEPVGKAEVVW